MTARIYNPALMGDIELKAGFVARQFELDELINLARSQPRTGVLQHVLILGQRGMGKTSLGLRFISAIKDDPELAAEWQPIPFFEESYGVTDLASLWYQALRHLAEITRDSAILRLTETLPLYISPEKLAARYLDYLHDYSRQHSKRLILFIENIDAIFDQFRDHSETARLRAVLQETDFLFIVGTAVKSFQDIKSSTLPLYEFFRQIRLTSLTPKETRDILENVGKRESRSGLLKVLQSDPGRVEVICRLTSGNPRLVVLAARLMDETPSGNAKRDLERLVDEQTPYFKARIEQLPTQARRVFHALAEAWAPVTAKELSRQTRLSSSYVSAQLRTLIDMDYAETASIGKKKTRYYQVKERFYNLYYIYRFTRDQKKRLEYLLDFISELFGIGALNEYAVNTLQRIVKTDNVGPEDLIEVKELLRRELEKETGLGHQYHLTISAICTLCLQKGVAIPHILSKNVAMGEPLTGKADEYIEQASHYLLTHPKDISVRLLLIAAHIQAEQYELAESEARRSTAIWEALDRPSRIAAINGPADVNPVPSFILYVAKLLTRTAPNIAERALETAFKLAPGQADIISAYVESLIRSGKNELASALTSNLPDTVLASKDLLLARALLAASTGSADASIGLLKSLVKERPQDIVALHELASQYLATGAYEKAIETTDQALAIQPHSPEIARVKARALGALNMEDLAEAQFRYAVTLAEQSLGYDKRLLEFFYRDLGLYLCRRGKFKEAIAQFEICTKLSPSKSYAWSAMACALYDDARLPEALAAIEKGLKTIGSIMRPNLMLLRACLFHLTGDSASAIRALEGINAVEWNAEALRAVFEIIAAGVKKNLGSLALAVLESNFSEVMETLILAVRIYLGENLTAVPREIFEVAEEAAKRIRASEQTLGASILQLTYFRNSK